MPRDWGSRDYAVIICVSTACLCLVILVAGTVLGVLAGLISVKDFESIQGASAGGGLVGFSLVIYKVISIALRGRPANDK